MKCAAPCRKCRQSEFGCSDCAEGYELRGWKCIHTSHIEFYVELDSTYSRFMDSILQFKQDIVSLSGVKSLTPSDITILTIDIGSVDVYGTIHHEDP